MITKKNLNRTIVKPKSKNKNDYKKRISQKKKKTICLDTVAR